MHVEKQETSINLERIKHVFQCVKRRQRQTVQYMNLLQPSTSFAQDLNQAHFYLVLTCVESVDRPLNSHLAL